MVRLVTFTTVLVVSLAHVAALALITPPPSAIPTPQNLVGGLPVTSVPTCGYENGDPFTPYLALNGYGCQADTVRGIWGICPTGVIATATCDMVGYCVDTGRCSSGCGRVSTQYDPKLTRLTWYARIPFTYSCSFLSWLDSRFTNSNAR